MQQPERNLTAAEAVQAIQHKMLNGQPSGLWLTRYIDSNAVAIQSLIENDTFGLFSDFDEENNPAPSPIDQVNILQSFLKGEARFAEYDIFAITQNLKVFTDNMADQINNLENVLYAAQLHREEPWSTLLPWRLTGLLKALNKIQMLNQMERMLNAIVTDTQSEQEKQDKIALQAWLMTHRTQIAHHPEEATASFLQEWSARLNTSDVVKVLRAERQTLLRLYNRIKVRILTLSELRLSDMLNLHQFLRDGVNFTLHMGAVFLLPYRIFWAFCRDIFGQIFKKIRRYTANFLNNEAAWFLAFLSYVLLFSLMRQEILRWTNVDIYDFSNILIMLGVQIFPESWSGTFIGKMALGFSVSEWALGLTLGIVQKVSQFFTPAQPEMISEIVPVPVVADIASAEKSLNKDQKSKLLRLLMTENNALGSRDIPEEKKSKKRGKIGGELLQLHNTTALYSLSRMDKKILAKQPALPEEFEDFAAEINGFRSERQAI